jgi:hypothetical protein
MPAGPLEGTRVSTTRKVGTNYPWIDYNSSVDNNHAAITVGHCLGELTRWSSVTGHPCPAYCWFQVLIPGRIVMEQ